MESRLILIELVVELADSVVESADSTVDSGPYLARINMWVGPLHSCLSSISAPQTEQGYWLRVVFWSFFPRERTHRKKENVFLFIKLRQVVPIFWKRFC